MIATFCKWELVSSILLMQKSEFQRIKDTAHVTRCNSKEITIAKHCYDTQHQFRYCNGANQIVTINSNLERWICNLRRNNERAMCVFIGVRRALRRQENRSFHCRVGQRNLQRRNFEERESPTDHKKRFYNHAGAY